jgi:NADPH:quinone reductase-like Zn-dependent oxidoreductase
MSTPINQAIVAYSTPVGDKDHDYTFEVAVVDYPTIDEEGDDVIIEVEAAPINPSDLGRMMGGGLWVAALSRNGTKQVAPSKLVTSFPQPIFDSRPSLQSTTPVRMGNEGCGTVVAAGAKAKALIGKRVCFVTGQSYVRFAKASAKAVVPLTDGMAAELGASVRTPLQQIQTLLAMFPHFKISLLRLLSTP